MYLNLRRNNTMIKRKKFYVDSKALEEYWTGWLTTDDEYAWSKMSDMIYQMCGGIATHFNPATQEIHEEHTHDAFMLTIEKIRLGKLRFEPGRAPVFNLLTTTIFRHLYSKMNKEKRRKTHHAKYIEKFINEECPELAREFANGSILTQD
jgi:hypothetical protein